MHPVSSSFIDVAFFHLVLWGVVGLALGLVVKVLVLVHRRRPRPEDEKAFYIASVSFLVVLATVGAHMNVFVLPEMLSRISILFDGVLLLACLSLGFALFHLARRAGRPVAERFVPANLLDKWTRTSEPGCALR